MGRGNVCVTGPYEGLYYIDNDHIHVYRRNDPYADEPETRLMGDLSSNEIMGDDWLYDDWGTGAEEDDILECFIDSFTMMFPSFDRPGKERWVGADRSVRVLLENRLFVIGVEDNEWSLAVKLIQKEDPYDDHLSGLQKQHYQRYLDGMKKDLLERLPSIGAYAGAWTHQVITKEEAIA